MVPPNRGAIDAHEIDVCDVIHELEELDLRPRRLCNELVHAMQRGHVRLFSAEIARDFAYDFASVAKSEKQRCIVVGKIESRENGQGAEHQVEVVALVSQVAFVAVGQGHVFSTDQHLS